MFRNRANETLSFTFDALNRLTAKNLPGSEPDVAYTYDLLGRMTGASQSGHALSFAWDALGRNLDQTGPSGTMASAFDVAGRRTRLTWPDSFYVDYDYLTTGEMKAVRANGATSGADVLATFGHDDLGRRSSLTRGDTSVASYSYDAVSRLTRLADDLVGTASDQVIDLAYNPAGQIVGRAASNDAYSFVSYANGTIGSTADGLNRLASLGGATPTYDARGNMTSDGAGAFTYSSENLLVSATGSATLTYDPLMRLSRWLENGAGRRNLYDGQHLALETDDAGTVRMRHVFGPGVDEPLVSYSGTGTTASSAYHLHADERGSVTAASRGSNGSVPVINKYDEYGMPGPLPRFGRYRYTGQAFYGNIGLYDYKARWYHPGVGRFLQTDPIGYEAGMNPYPYAGGDPVNATDPSGLAPQRLEHCTGTRLCSNHDGSGGSGGAYVTSTPGFASFARGGSRSGMVPTNSNATQDACAGCIVVTAQWASSGSIFDSFSLGGIYSASFSASNEYSGVLAEFNPIVITAQRRQNLGGVKIDFDLRAPMEQIWVGYSSTEIVNLPVRSRSRGHVGENRGRPPRPGYRVIIHTHPWWSLQAPGSDDFGQAVPVYGITPHGVWVLLPGSRQATVISGYWSSN